MPATHRPGHSSTGMKTSVATALASLAMTSIALPQRGLAQQPPAEDIDSTEFRYPVVITPTRLRQSLSDVPASVTVITADTIRRYGITRIEEALRLVPGMAVSRASGNDYRVNYHGTDATNPRRLNVLIDGVSAYRPGFSRVDWPLLPVALEDVDRIEVTRGPNSAAYGPNSMMAVINILTKHPKDVDQGMVSASVGSHHENGATARLATKLGATHLYATADNQRDSGYDNITLRGGAHDSTRVQRLNLRAETDLGATSSLELQAAIVDGKRDVGYVQDVFQITAPDIKNTETLLSGKWTRALSSNHELQIRGFHDKLSTKQTWLTCPFKALFVPDFRTFILENASLLAHIIDTQTLSTGDQARDDQIATQLNNILAPVGGVFGGFLTACGATNQNMIETRTQLEVQDTYVVSEALRLVGGVGLRYQSADSNTYFGGQVGNTVRWLFGHAEYRPTSSTTLNVGGYGESNSLGRSTFSPRLAVNYHLSEGQALRAVYSQGTRTPDLGEVKSNWTETVTGLTPLVMGSSTGRFHFYDGNPNLTEERIRSLELGYLLMVRSAGLTLDSRLFDDRLTQLMSATTALETLTISNSGHVRLTGAETQLNWDFAPRWSSWLSYAFLLNREASTPVETTQYARHSGGLGLSHALTNDWRLSLASYGSTGNGYKESRYARTDLSASHTFRLGTLPGSSTLVVSYLHTPVVNTYLYSVGAYQSSYNDRLSLHGTVRVAF